MKALLILPHRLEKMWLQRRGWSSEKVENLCKSEEISYQTVFPLCQSCQTAPGSHHRTLWEMGLLWYCSPVRRDLALGHFGPSERCGAHCRGTPPLPEIIPAVLGQDERSVTAASLRRLLGNRCLSSGRSQRGPEPPPSSLSITLLPTRLLPCPRSKAACLAWLRSPEGGV